MSVSVTCTTAHGSAGSLSHWGRPGFEPATSWILVGFISAAPQWELPFIHSFVDFVWYLTCAEFDKCYRIMSQTSISLSALWVRDRHPPTRDLNNEGKEHFYEDLSPSCFWIYWDIVWKDQNISFIFGNQMLDLLQGKTRRGEGNGYL